MAVPTADDMSLQEIARTLSDFRSEFRSQVAQLVRTDVYRAEQAADRARIAALEKEDERRETVQTEARARVDTDRASDRRLVLGAIAGTILNFVSSVLLIAFTHH